jgi:hypothetical protein
LGTSAVLLDGNLSVVLPRFSSVFLFSVFHRLFRYRGCSNWYKNTKNGNQHSPTSYLLDKTKLSKYMQPILKYSKNNMWFF